MIGVYIDLSNMYHVARKLYNRKIDYSKLKAKIQGDNWVAYGCNRGGEADRFIVSLAELGILAKYKKTRQVAPGVFKGDWDVGITVDIIRDGYDTVILVTNDGDFVELTDYLEVMGRQIIIVGHEISSCYEGYEQIELTEDVLEQKGKVLCG